MKIGWLSSFCVILVFSWQVPSTRAAQIENFGSQITAHQGESVYRLKSDTRPWQLTSIASGQIQAEFVFKDRLFLIARHEQSSQVWVSEDGLSFKQLDIISDFPLGHILLENNLLIYEQETNHGRYFVSSDGLDFHEFTSGLGSPMYSDRFFNRNGKNFYVDQVGTQVVTYQIEAGLFLPRQSFPCLTTRLNTQPIPNLICDQHQVLLFDETQTWKILTEHLTNIQSSATTLAATTDFYGEPELVIFQDGRLSRIKLTGILTNLPDSILLSGRRIFIETATNQWAEFGYSPCCRVDLFNQGQFKIISDEAYLDINGDIFRSFEIGKYDLVTAAGSFDRIIAIEGGYLAWRSQSSLSQFSNDGLTFSKLDATWAQAAKLDLVRCFTDKCWAWVINTSGNYNLYQLDTGQSSWRRLTLPTKPTYALPIAQTRLLPSGTLVEITAPISVVRGIVATDVVYLQDLTGGIQVYLSSAKGQINQGYGSVATATGEISTSKTKRILLNSLSDFEVSNEQQIVALTSSDIKTATENLGKVHQLTGALSSVTSTSLIMSDNSASLKIRFQEVADALKEAGSVTLPAIVDWSSSSSQVEAWYLNYGLNILADAAPVAQEKNEPASHAAISKKTGSSSSTKIASAVKTSSALTKPSGSVLVADSTSQPPSSSKKTTDTKTTQPIMTNIAGLLAGLIVSRGFRLKALLLGS